MLPGILGVLIIPLLLQRLAPASFAVFAMCASVITFAPAFDLGISRAALRRMASLQDGCAGERRSLARESLRRAWCVGAVVGTVLGVIALSLGFSSAPFTATWHSAGLPLACAALGVPVAVVANTQRSLLEGIRQFSSAASVRIALGVLTVMVPLAFAMVTERVEVLVLSLVVLRAFAYLHQDKLLANLGLGGREENVPEQADQRGGFWTESLWYALLGLLGLAMSGLDRFVVAWLGGVSADTLAVLLAPQEVALRVITLPAALVPALLVRMAVSTSSPEANRALVAQLFWVVGGGIFVTVALAIATAPIWVHRVFQAVDAIEVTAVTQVLLIGVFSNAIAQFPFVNLIAQGQVKEVAICHAVELPIFLLAVVVLVDRYSMVGAAACWSGRIVCDTMLLLWRSDVRVSTQGVSYWQWCHGLGVSMLTMLALVL